MSIAQPKFNQVNIVSADPEASLQFYRLLGIDIPEASVFRTRTGIHHAGAKAGDDEPHFDIDSTAFAQKWNSGWRGRDDLKGRVVVGFDLPTRASVDALYGALTGAGHTGLQAPFDAFWGARYAIVEDPDGIAVGLMSPISTDLRSPTPEV